MMNNKPKPYVHRAGTKEEQIATAKGDCVRCMYFKLKELSEKFGDEHFRSGVVIVPPQHRFNEFEDLVVHHVVENTKLGLIIDTSNGREIMGDKDEYLEGSGAVQYGIGKTMNGWRRELCAWIVANNVTCPNFHDGLVYMFMEWEHTQLYFKHNPRDKRSKTSDEEAETMIQFCRIGMTEEQFRECIMEATKNETPMCERPHHSQLH